MEEEKLSIFWRKGLPLLKGKYPGYNPRTVAKAGIRCEYDVAVPMRDGVRIYVDVFRPDKEGQYPVLIAWSGSRLRLAILLGFALFVLVGLFHLIQAYWLPSSLRLVHGVEILSDSLLYAAVLVLLMTRDRGRIVRSSVVTLGGADAVGV